MKFYHVTRPASAESIRRRGFKNSVRYFRGHRVVGVWLSDKPWADGGYIAPELVDGQKLSAVVVNLDGRALRRFEVVNDVATYREWCVPREIVNAALLSR